MKKGFTLVEALVLVIIMGLMVAMAVPLINNEQLRFSSVMNNLIMLVKDAKQNAITKGEWYGFMYETRNDSCIAYFFEDANRNRTYDAGETKVERYLRGVTFSTSISEPIIFFPDGTVSEALDLVVESQTYEGEIWVLLSGFINYEVRRKT